MASRPVPQARPTSPPPARPRKRGGSSLLLWLLAGGFAVSVAAVSAVLVLLLVLALGNSRLPDETRILGVDVGGMTQGEAAEALAAADPVVAIEDGERSWPQALSALGIALDAEATLKNADDAPAFTIDFNAAQAELTALSEVVNVPATLDTPGRALDVPVLLARLQADAPGELADLRLELPMFETERLTPAESVMASYNGPTSTHIVEAGEELGLIAKRYNVSISDVAALNGIDDPNLIYPGQSLTIPAPGEYAPSAAEAPPAPSASGRSILVSISNQRIYAYENGALVHSHLTSTGLPDTPTVLGDYHVYVKHTATDMSGPGYYLPGVPYTMYFYQGYAIHGTYWHNNFGRPMSHGCVNLPVEEAAWFFDFATVGTLVRVVA
jgi:lipoprotein-anchoring transpeptidase ErfK/SrfK